MDHVWNWKAGIRKIGSCNRFRLNHLPGWENDVPHRTIIEFIGYPILRHTLLMFAEVGYMGCKSWPPDLAFREWKSKRDTHKVAKTISGSCEIVLVVTNDFTILYLWVVTNDFTHICSFPPPQWRPFPAGIPWQTRTCERPTMANGSGRLG